jgi:hypothetical protein
MPPLQGFDVGVVFLGLRFASPQAIIRHAFGVILGCLWRPFGTRSWGSIYRWLRCSPEGQRLATGYHCAGPSRALSSHCMGVLSYARLRRYF